jgi:hypothetical protein
MTKDVLERRQRGRSATIARRVHVTAACTRSSGQAMTSVVRRSALNCGTWLTAYQESRWPASRDAGIESFLHTAASD